MQSYKLNETLVELKVERREKWIMIAIKNEVKWNDLERLPPDPGVADWMSSFLE